MTRVIDDLCDNDLFYVDDIERIEAIRFEGAESSNDFFKILANSKINEKMFPKLIRTEVNCYDNRIDGTHAYYLYLVNGEEINLPVW